MFDSGTVVHKIDDKNDIVHIGNKRPCFCVLPLFIFGSSFVSFCFRLVFKAKPPAQKRDFCMLRSWRVNDQHTEFIVSNRSVSFAAVPGLYYFAFFRFFRFVFVWFGCLISSTCLYLLCVYSPVIKLHFVSFRLFLVCFLLVTENYVRGEVLSSGWVMRVTSRDGKKFMHVTYILQLGTKALTLALGIYGVFVVAIAFVVFFFVVMM